MTTKEVKGVLIRSPKECPYRLLSAICTYHKRELSEDYLLHKCLDDHHFPRLCQLIPSAVEDGHKEEKK